MNMYSNDYLRNQIATASKEQLLIMFYDGAIRFTARARNAMLRKDIEDRNYCVGKATAIISELAATLDHEIGGKIAEDLDALYAYMLRELNLACVKQDPQALESVESILSDLRETWTIAIEQVRQEKKPEMALPKAPPAEYRPLSVAL